MPRPLRGCRRWSPAVELAAALLLVRHAARAVAELAPAAAAGPELVEVRVERVRQRRGEPGGPRGLRLGAIAVHVHVFGCCGDHSSPCGQSRLIAPNWVCRFGGT